MRRSAAIHLRIGIVRQTMHPPKENSMQTRRQFTTLALALLLMPGNAALAQEMPSASRIEQQLQAPAQRKVRPDQRVTIREFKRRPDLRRAAPSIDIQAINFAFGSEEIPRSQYRKVEQIADALERILRRRPGTRILIEGHTDAVGSAAYNLALSERRAESLKRVLVREFDIPRRALETVGYGEEFPLVPTQSENWRNRRVTLRRIDDFLQ
jgi:outer membrane protein OmpA-like peptidoglycan-associated protein